MQDTIPQADPQMDEEKLRKAIAAADASFASSAHQAGTERRAEKGIIQKGADLWKSAGVGIAKAGIETKDFLFGEPAEADKSDLRRGIEQRGRDLSNESMANSLTMGTTQIITGLIGAGKLMAPVKALQKVKSVRGGVAAYETARGAIAGAVVIDPHEERLSNLIESFPELQNPVTEFLASDPSDSAAEGRFKNALEGIGADFALLGAIKVIKLLRSGDAEAAGREIAKLEKARQANADEFGMDFTGGNQPLPKDEPVVAPQVVTGANPQAAIVDEVGVQPAAKDEPAAIPEAIPEEGVIEQIGAAPLTNPKTGEALLPTEKVAPKVLRTQGVSEKELDDILSGSKSDSEAIRQFGSVTAARANGHKFAQVKLPWQKLYTQGGTGEFMASAVRVLEGRFNAAKGGAILKDDRVRSLVNDLSDQFGEDPAMVLGQLADAGKNASKMVAQMEAGLRIGNRMFNDANDLASRIRLGNLEEFGGNPEAAKSELQARLALAFDTLSSANSIRANAGRAVRRNRSQFAISKKDLAKLRSMDPDKVTVIMERAGGDPKKVAMILNESWGSRVLNEATWHLTNGLLWMWPTHLVNVTTNAAMSLQRPAEKLFGSKALQLLERDPARKAELGHMAKQAKLEFTYTVTSLFDAWSNAVAAFKSGDSILSPHNTEYFNKEITGVTTPTLPWKPVKGVWDLAYNAQVSANYRTIVGLPTRTMGAMDEMFKTMRYRAVVQARAAVEAGERGLSGQDLKDYIQKAMDQAIDPATGAALDGTVLREAQTTTFQRDLDYETWTGSTGRALQNLRKTDPKVALILPFVKTPLNVIHYGIKMTPGLNVLQREFNDAIKGKLGAEAQAHAVGQMTMGSIFMGLAAYLTVGGHFTGGGPSDPKLKQELVATGWKPYSFVSTDEKGTKSYFQVGRFDPIGMAMGITADIVNLQSKDPEADYSDLIMASAVALAKNLGDKSFLLNLNMAIDAAMDPEKSLPKWAGRTAGGMIPLSSLLRGHSPDPYLREARGFVDNFIRGVPGIQETLPVTRDVWGDPVERYVGIVDHQEFDVVDSEHNRIMLQTGKGIQKPSPQFEGVDLRDTKLADGRNAYERLQELAGKVPGQKSLKAVLKDLIESQVYQEMPDGDSSVRGTRLNALAARVQRYREAAKKVLIRENPELQALIKARQREAAGARLESRRQAQQQPATFQDLLAQ